MNFNLSNNISFINNNETVLEEPVVEEPAVLEPAVLEPAVLEQAILEPAILEPVIEEQAVLEPAVLEPAVLEQAILEPAILEPVVEEQAILEPVIEEPAILEPVIEEPAILEPVVEEQAVLEPAVLEPAVEEPAILEPVVEEPVIEEPAVLEPAILEPVVEEPAILEPVVEEPVVEEPVVEEPVVLEPAAVLEPAVEEPVIENIQYLIESKTIPKLVFIVPYRDREQQLIFFRNHMKIVLEDIEESEYKILYIHQKDKRSFNRGAMKNIGFLLVKQQYPDDYKSITLVFNDIDTMPYTKNFLNYETTKGIVKHFYGYKFTLGGIVSITAGDFELTNGFPNYWSWGYEDNALQQRVLKSRLTIDRNQFYPILNKNILQFNNSMERIMNRKEFDRFWDEHKYNKINDGYQTIHELEYFLENDFVNITNFKTTVDETPDFNQIHNLKNGSTPFKIPGRRGMSMVLT
jgi:hypothetical protein